MIAQQIHNRFKIFTGQLQGTQLGPLAAEIEAFAKGQNVAAKSIGVEFLESEGKLVISLGYRDDEAGYGVKLHVENLGKWDGQHAAELETAMSNATAKFADILCHELFVTGSHDFCMVLMTKV